MSNELQIFNFENKNVEIIEINNEPLFNARNVGECLEISNIRDTIRGFDKDEVVKLTNETSFDAVGITDSRKFNSMGELFLTEAGLYKIIFISRVEGAKKFQKWVTKEVLPSIRKTGKYEIAKNTAESQAKVEFENRMAVAAILRVPEHIAAIEVAKMVKTDTGVDYESLLLKSPIMDNIAEEEIMLEPTEIGRKLGDGMSGRDTNHFIATLGWQTKKKYQGWKATKIGEKHCVRHSWKRYGKSGYNYKWNVQSVLKEWKERSSW